MRGLVEAWPAMQTDIALVQLRIVGKQLRDVRFMCRSFAPHRSVEWLAEADVPPELEARAGILRGDAAEDLGPRVPRREIDLPVEALDPRQPHHGNRLARRRIESREGEVDVVLRRVGVGWWDEKRLRLGCRQLVTEVHSPGHGEKQQRDENQASNSKATPLEKRPDCRPDLSQTIASASSGRAPRIRSALTF